MLGASHFSIIARFFVKDGDEIFCETEEAKSAVGSIFTRKVFLQRFSLHTVI